MDVTIYIELYLQFFYTPGEVVLSMSHWLNDQTKYPDMTSSALVVGRPHRLERQFNSSTVDVISDFSLAHFFLMEDLRLLESTVRTCIIYVTTTNRNFTVIWQNALK